MTKKIGCVIAYSKDHNNYGTSLQGFATLKKIRDLGYDCEVIRYNKHLSFFEKIKLVFLMFRCGGTSDKMRVLKERQNLKKYPQYAEGIRERTVAVNKYKTTHLDPYFKVYDGYEALHKGSLNYDAVVVGSDQVWTPMSLYSKYYNLLFVDDSVKKIAYASSFGVSSIPAFQQKETGSYLERFAYIGVREQKGKEIVDSLSHKKAQVVADPTILLTHEEWEKEISSSKVHETEPYIFCYFLGTNQETRKAVNELKAKTGYKIITIRHMDEYVEEDENFGDEAPYNVDPNDFIKYISEAAYVCTDSFHCSVFSILFESKFMTFYRFANTSSNSRNSRIDSLFGLFGLQERLYHGDISKIENNIDYEYVGKRLSELRAKSLDFLSNALKFE
ncbi:MAG: polysaccharide pyruvyl transferase family protein [Paludibacteraceae bacterium]|nr:polysaccharide pyruvyl transferase family protein [Paludibacteraceae bacterium]